MPKSQPDKEVNTDFDGMFPDLPSSESEKIHCLQQNISVLAKRTSLLRDKIRELEGENKELKAAMRILAKEMIALKKDLFKVRELANRYDRFDIMDVEE